MARRTLAVVGGILLIACAEPAGSADESTAAEPPVASAPTPATRAVSLDTVPAQPFMWHVGSIDSFITSEFPGARARPATSRRLSQFSSLPRAAYVADGTEVDAYVFGDQIAAATAADRLRAVIAAGSRVFTSNNLVIVVTPDTTRIARELEERLTSRDIRSGIPR